MIAKVLREYPEIEDFVAETLQHTHGVFMLHRSQSQLLLLIDDSGEEHHLDLSATLSRELGEEFTIVGGGRYGKNSFPNFYAPQRTLKWAFDWHSWKFGRIPDELHEEIASIISGGEHKDLLNL